MGRIRPLPPVQERSLVDSLVPVDVRPSDTPDQVDAKRAKQQESLQALIAKAVEAQAGTTTFTPAEMQRVLAAVVLTVR